MDREAEEEEGAWLTMGHRRIGMVCTLLEAEGKHGGAFFTAAHAARAVPGYAAL